MPVRRSSRQTAKSSERRMLQDYKLGIRMLLKYPGLTLAGGLALAIAIGVGAGWYDLMGKLMAPPIPLPEGNRIVTIETRNILTTEPELRVARDFLEWRRELRTIADLGAYRTVVRNLIVDNTAPEPIQMAELTAAALRTGRVRPLLGRILIDSDETPGAPSVVVLGFEVWRRSLGGRQDVVGSVVKLGNAPATVIGVMPEGFGYPINHQAWMPLQLSASYGALEGGPVSVIGRLARGVTRAEANAELRVLGERTAAALPETHEHLRLRAMGLGQNAEFAGHWQLAMTNLPVLLLLIIACMNVGTLVYARTATREAEIAVRSALGASRGRIIVQLFVETLLLASTAAVVGLVAADRILRWGIEGAFAEDRGAPFWMTGGLRLTTILYAGGLAVASAVMLALLPALRATRARVQPHLASLGAGGATLRFGRVWTSAMVAQVTFTALAIPTALENTSQTIRNQRIRAEFPSREYLAAHLDLDQPSEGEAASAFAERRNQMFGELERRIAEEPGVLGITFADRAPGSGPPRSRRAQIEPAPGVRFDSGSAVSAVGPGFFETFNRPIVAGRAFHAGDHSPTARTVIVNEAFVRGFRRRGGTDPIGARLRYSDTPGSSETEPWFEVVGIVRDFGLDPDDEGNEKPFVFHAAAPGTVSPLVISVRIGGDPAPLVARLPVIAAAADARWYVQEARPLDEWIWRRDRDLIQMAAALAGVTSLVLFLSALGIYSLLSVSVSRRTREIGLRAALGANPRRLLAGILSRAVVLLGSGLTAGGVVLLYVVTVWKEDLMLFVGWLGVTAAVMLTAGLIASIVPARRALRINPSDALRDA